MRKRAMRGEFTIRKSNGVRVHHEKRSDRVTVTMRERAMG